MNKNICADCGNTIPDGTICICQSEEYEVPNFLKQYTEQFATRQAKWIDDSILSALPSWKRKVLLKTKSRLVAKLIRANIKVERWTLIEDFGQEVRIKVNNKVVASRKFKY